MALTPRVVLFHDRLVLGASKSVQGVVFLPNDALELKTASITSGSASASEERHQVWSYMTHLYPPYLGYQLSTTRHIPVVMIKAVRPVEVFTADAG